jgi:hypothetical protein
LVCPGYQRSLVALSFLIETAFVEDMGILSRTILRLALARDHFPSDDFGDPEADSSYCGDGGRHLVVTIAAALLMTWSPARSRLEIWWGSC